jgi:hypothetical protein
MKKRVVAVSAAAAATIAATGVGWSMWMVQGVAMAPATAASATLEVSAAPANGLYPGGYVVVPVTVRNPNAYPVQFGHLWVEGVNVDANHQYCPPQVVQIDPTTADRQTVLLPQSEQVFEVGVGLEPSAPQSCDGAVFDVEYGANGSVGN